MEIKTKEQINEQLDLAFGNLLNWLKGHDGAKFEKPRSEGKWSAGQHADHLVKSTAAFRKGLAMPRLVLKTTFGTNNRTEHSYASLLEKYEKKLSEGGKASGRYIPPTIQNGQKQEIMARLERELESLKAVLGKWSEEDMGKYILPHPLLGKLTVRELAFFTVLHTNHHLDILKERY